MKPASSGSSKISRRENETPEERARRRAEKQKTVSMHRAEILRRVHQSSGRTKLHKRDELVCPIVFDNTLPPVPVEPKSMQFPFDDDFMYGYDIIHGVSTEAGQLYQMHTEVDVGVPINLIDPSQYLIPPPSQRPKLHELDEYITSAQFAKPAAKLADKDKEEHVEWMINSTYMHLDLYDAVYKHADPKELKLAKLVTRKRQLDAAVTGSLRERIDASFKITNSGTAPTHPTNAALKPKRVWTVLPDQKRWAAHQVFASFDAEPASRAAADENRAARMERALIRTPASQPVNISEGTVKVDYLLPATTDTTATDDTRFDGVRSYHMVVEKVQRSKGDEHYLLHWDDENGAVYFAPVKARATLTKYAADNAAQGRATQPIASVDVLRRPLNAEEKDLLDEAEADLYEVNPAPIKSLIASRRRARAEEAEALRQAVAAEIEATIAPTLSPPVSGVKRTAAEAFGSQPSNGASHEDDDAFFGEED